MTSALLSSGVHAGVRASRHAHVRASPGATIEGLAKYMGDASPDAFAFYFNLLYSVYLFPNCVRAPPRCVEILQRGS